jgi:hypothetical protein
MTIMTETHHPKFKEMFDEFKALDHATKKERVLGLCELIKDKVNFAK